MASAKRASLKDSKEDVQLELIYSDDTQFKYWNSSLFNEVYLRKDLPEKYSEMWEEDEAGGFYEFLNNFTNLCKEYESNEKELKSWSETETINNWIKLILEDLGWTNNCKARQNPFLEETSFRYDNKTYRTDILIVDLPEEKKYISSAKSEEKLTEARESVLIPVEAKYWNRLEQYRQGEKEDKKRIDTEHDDISRTTSPDQQTLKYMEVLDKDWGILTDGARWRLFNKEISGEDSNRYFEFNLYSLFESIVTAETHHDHEEVKVAAKYFYYFFSKNSFFPEESGIEPFSNEVLRYSKKYVNKVEEDLKDRFVKAMNFACNGFYRSAQKNRQDTDLKIIRNISESALFNILFTKSLESKNILPMNSTEYKKISLSSLIDKIEKFDPDKESIINDKNLGRAFKKSNGSSFTYKSNGYELHEKILRLTKIIHDGQAKKDDFGFEIAGFRESVFSDMEWKQFQSCKLENKDWVNILFQLGYAESDIKNRKYQQIPYSFFTPRQLGSIYESFLEFQLEKANTDMVFDKFKEKGKVFKGWIEADLNSRKYKNKSIPKVNKGELFFTPDNKERKATGSYYTPDNVVSYIVEKTLKPLVSGKSSKELLKLKICDPAMGSGHFLVGALNYLTISFMDTLAFEEKGDLKISVPEAKRIVLDSCIYGIDINSRAVKLAKMSLWLESAYINKKLERLNDQLKTADSLMQKSFSDLFGLNQIDAIVSNPPYKIEFKPSYVELLTKNYISFGHAQNSYTCFLEKALLERKNELFSIGMIVPNSFIVGEYYSDLRDFIEDTGLESQIIDLGARKVFKDANVYTAIVTIAGKGSVKLAKLDAENDFNNIYDIEFSNPIKDEKNGWRQPSSTDYFFDIFPSIGDLCEVKDIGFNYWSKGRGKVRGGSIGSRVLYEGEKLNKKDLPYLKGRDINKYSSVEANRYLKFDWPSLLNEGDTFRYSKNYFELEERVVYRQTSKELISSVVSKNICNDKTLHCVVPKDSRKISNEFLVAYLNSKLANELYKTLVEQDGQAFAQVKTVVVKQLPVPIPKTAENKKALNKIEKFSRKLIDRNKGLSREEELKLNNLINDFVLTFKLNKTSEVA